MTVNLKNLLDEPFESKEIPIIREHLFQNIATDKNIFVKTERGRIIRSIPGAVLASPSRPGPNFSQDYRFDWVRDSAITTYEVAYSYEKSKSEIEKKYLREYINNYLNFVKMAQSQPPLNGVNILGEPKFNIDGTLWVGNWARPQNDSPALRVITLIYIANILINEGSDKTLIDMLYHPILPSLIKTDLEYIANRFVTKIQGLP